MASTFRSGGKTISSSTSGQARMDGAKPSFPLFVTSAKFKCQREADDPAQFDEAQDDSSSTPLTDCVLTLVASALKCIVNLPADNSLSTVSTNQQWVTISLEEIIRVSTSGPWLSVEYAPATFTQWARRWKSSLVDLPSKVLSLTVKLENEEECFDIMEAVLAAKMRLLRHLKWLEDRCPLTDKIFLCSVTSKTDTGPEVVLAQCPRWGTAVALPADWCRFLNGGVNVNSPQGTISIYLHTHLGLSVVHLSAAALESRVSGAPKDNGVVVFSAEMSPPVQTTVAELARHNSVTYYTGSDLQAKLVLRWVDISAKKVNTHAAADGPHSILRPADALKSLPKDSLDAVISAHTHEGPELTLRHLLIALSFLIAVVAMVTHHFIKNGKMSSGFLLLDLAAGISLAGMAVASLPILAAGSATAEQRFAAIEAGQSSSQDQASENVSGASTSPSQVERENSDFDDHDAEWALVLLQADVVERDVSAEVDSMSHEAETSIEDSARADSVSDSDSNQEEPATSLPPQRRSLSKQPTLHKMRTLQTSGCLDGVDVDYAEVLSPRKRSSSTAHIMPEDCKKELMALFDEPQWQPPAVHPILVEDMVQRFYVGCKQDMAETRRRLLITKKFREENGINNVLEQPQPYFFEFKRAYEHGILNLRTKGGALVTLERVGGVRKAFDSMMAKKVPKSELMKHMFFLSEYYDIQADPRPLPHGKLVKILDIDGLGMYDVFGSIFNFLYECTNIGTIHYPERLHSMVIVNAPTWINMLWKAFTPAIDPATRERIQLCGSSKSSVLKLLSAELDMDAIPTSYGGQNTCSIGDSPYEQTLADFVKKVNEKNGISS